METTPSFILPFSYLFAPDAEILAVKVYTQASKFYRKNNIDDFMWLRG